MNLLYSYKSTRYTSYTKAKHSRFSPVDNFLGSREYIPKIMPLSEFATTRPARQDRGFESKVRPIRTLLRVNAWIIWYCH
jgi:hypothetical protein